MNFKNFFLSLIISTFGAPLALSIRALSIRVVAGSSFNSSTFYDVFAGIYTLFIYWMIAWFFSVLFVLIPGFVFFFFLLIFKIKNKIDIYGLIGAGIILFVYLFLDEFSTVWIPICIMANALIFCICWRIQDKRLRKKESQVTRE